VRVHALASRPQYERHIRAVWRHLPDDLRGDFLTGPQAVGIRHRKTDVFMVGAGPEIPRAPQRQVYVEHGAGQAYPGDANSRGSWGYHGSIHDERVRWYISPRSDVADSWGRKAFVAGCPALDEYADVQLPKRPVAAITFHWDAARLCPEARTAAPHWLPRMREIAHKLRAEGFAVVGHFHPRNPTMRAAWRELGVDIVSDVDSILRYASVLIADNTSLMYEMAALGRPVLALNSPLYRRDVHHGLRFWTHVPGWQLDEPAELLDLDVAWYVGEDPSRDLRVRAAAYAYGGVPIGGAGAAAAAWLTRNLAET
jgi:hypothetical protein